MSGGRFLAESCRKAPVHGPLRSGTSAQVLPVVCKACGPVGGQTCRVAFVNGKYDAGLLRSAPGGQFRGGGHCGRCRQGPEAFALLAPVNQEAAQQPGRVLIRPARQARGTGLESQNTDGIARCFDDVGKPRVLGQSRQDHPERVAHEAALPRAQFQTGHFAELDGEGI